MAVKTLEGISGYQVTQRLLDFMVSQGMSIERVETSLYSYDNGLREQNFSGQLTATGDWQFLDSFNLTSYTFSKNGTTLTEGQDYDIDPVIGKVRFKGNVSAGDTIDYSITSTRGYVDVLSPNSLTSDVIFRVETFWKSDASVGWTQIAVGRKINNTIGILLHPISGVAYNLAEGIKAHFFVSANRVVIVTVTGTNYALAYGGIYNPVCESSTNTEPFATWGSHRTYDVFGNWSSWMEPDNSSARVFPQGSYSAYASIWCGLQGRASRANITPNPSYFDFHYPSDDYPRLVLPVIISPENNVDSCCIGELPGMFSFPDIWGGETKATDSDGQVFYIFPDVTRTSPHDFFAVIDV